ncbi:MULTISPECIES: phage portal protein [Dethiosulfovibrio]|uniref:Phage portal protein n=2 Tax=Dethiosulfovibrio TaxID=47054 RepID=A0ABS9ESJ0_9BACT|nr:MULTISPECIES: phage portal protein [Dethiosulfovibrio]MCF4114693.1 phage portal protein [Dethiosulfovibrio russensis]MCF4143102.1 phage portal protein [Dethiosulfovibrio marinus]MCF4145198.1 phage portal protein [Dethiosulfovibrio acidaminovorans]
MSWFGKAGYVLDRAVGLVSPGAGARRMDDRAKMEARWDKRNYDAARIDRYGSGWVAVNKRPDETDRVYRDRIRARARDLERNNGIAQSVLLAMERHVVGTGLRPQAKILDADGTENEKLNREIEALWEVWAKPKNCDITGHDGFYGLQRMMVRRMVTDGEIYPILTAPEDGFIPLQIQMMEADALATWMPRAKDKRIVSGVEVNEYWRPLAYWFYRDDMETSSFGRTTEAVRVDAGRVLPMFVKTRPQAVRGISQFAHVMGNIRDSGEYMDAELMAARIAACFAAFIKTGSGNTPSIGRNATVQDALGRDKNVTRLEPGIVNTLPDGADVEFANPTHPNTGASDFVALQQRLIGAGTGQSYEVVSRDVSRTNYSSARAASLEDEEGYKVLRQFMVERVLEPLWEAFVCACVLSGKLNIRDYFQRPDVYNRCRWVPPGRQWVDPLKEVSAITKEMEAGITTLQDVCASKGKDWREVLEQISREREYMTSLNLGGLAGSSGIGQEALSLMALDNGKGE